MLTMVAAANKNVHADKTSREGNRQEYDCPECIKVSGQGLPPRKYRMLTVMICREYMPFATAASVFRLLLQLR